MTKYEELLEESKEKHVFVDEAYPFKSPVKGLYIDGNIALSDQLNTSAEKACVLAEELGHHCTSVGNILDTTDSACAKQEHQARMHGYNRLIGLSGLIDAFLYGCKEYHEAAEYLGVTEEYLLEAICKYREKYGTYAECGDYYLVFEPYLSVGKKLK